MELEQAETSSRPSQKGGTAFCGSTDSTRSRIVLTNSVIRARNLTFLATRSIPQSECLAKKYDKTYRKNFKGRWLFLTLINLIIFQYAIFVKTIRHLGQGKRVTLFSKVCHLKFGHFIVFFPLFSLSYRNSAFEK